MNTPTTYARPSGFALVVTLSLMILVAVISVGMLTLSATALRASSQEEAMIQARSNARLALMLAIGDLQKACGPDRAITAPASLVNSSDPQGVTGVWTPWNPDTAPDARDSRAKNDRFRQWLVSTTDGSTPADRNRAPLASSVSPDAVPLLDTGSLGEKNRGDGDQRIALDTTRIAGSPNAGGYAWAVIDESCKARLDLYEDKPAAASADLVRVASPPVDGVRALGGLDSFLPDARTSRLLVSMKTAHLLGSADKESLIHYSPDLNVHSASLLTDVVSGGLKRDLSLWFSTGLTSSERSSRVYGEAGLVDANLPGDPFWSYIEAFHQSYKRIGQRGVAGIRPPADGITASLPAGHRPSRGEEANPAAPSEPLLVPTVLRVDVIFSLVTRDVHGGRTNRLRNAGRPYMLHLLYLPVITLHNPYNVPMTVEGMKVSFQNIPIAFQFLVDNQPLTTGLVPLNQLYVGSEGNPGRTKDFGCTLTGVAGSSGSPTPFELQPGQTMLFGTPRVTPDWTWADEQPGIAGTDGVQLFDWRNDKTSEFSISPRLMTDPRIGNGFDIDWLAPRGLMTEAGREAGQGEGIVTLRGTERIGVRYGPFAPTAGNGAFNVVVQVIQRGAARDAGHFTYRYGTERRLNEILSEGTSLRFPTARRFPETFPAPRNDRPLSVMDLYEPNERRIKDYVNPKPFAIFSLGSRTTKESFVPTRIIADGNPTLHMAKMDVSTARSTPLGSAPLEMVLMPIRSGNAAIEEIRETREAFAFGGNGSLHGTPRATLYELPTAPLQSIGQLRHANLTSSGLAPQAAYTVGESLAHPLVGTENASSRLQDRTVALDHRWLANAALWDRYFFSTIADQPQASFGRDRAFKDVMAGFFAGTDRLPNQRLRPVGTAGSVPADLVSATSPHDVIAKYLLLDGGFNVNSVSEDAWVAILSALRETTVDTAAGKDQAVAGRTPLPRVNRPPGRNIDGQPLALRVNRWEGYRSLSDDQIRALAREIVTEIRARGPFLSLADFVNRGIGPENDGSNLKGTLQAAIDRLADFNQLAHADGIELLPEHLANHGYESILAGTGNTASFAPGAITQGDVLTPLGSRITVRGDTFRIRAYGEARDASGSRVTARAWCEAVVQRMPAFVDPAEDAASPVRETASGDSGSVNRRFGRRFEIITFRWLHHSEV